MMSIPDQTLAVRQITSLAEISDDYDVILCDLWGVVHNGVAAFPPASEALVAFRRRGGTVILITNAPRPSAPIRRQLLKLGVAPDAFDDIATSGDVTIGLIVERIDEPVLHIGPSRDLSLFAAAGEAAGRQPQRVALDGARYSLCTGLRDDVRETLADYEPELRALVAKRIPMICANPDIVIHRGETLIYCAGALAARFEALGGEVVYAGKPHAAIYRRALTLAQNARGASVNDRRVLAVGDGMKTDIAGAAQAGLDALLVTRGIHRVALHGESFESIADMGKLRRLCDEFSLYPKAAIGSLEG
jgi:HAD superfamily hydrolase (TIGR01459 family)